MKKERTDNSSSKAALIITLSWVCNESTKNIEREMKEKNGKNAAQKPVLICDVIE